MEMLACNIEDSFFYMLQNVLGRLFILVAAGHRLIGNLDQPAQRRFFFDDLSVKLNIEGSRQAVGQAGEVGSAPYTLKLAGALQFFFERNQVDGTGAIHEKEHLLEYSPVAVEVEVLGFEDFKYVEQSLIVKEDCSQD